MSQFIYFTPEEKARAQNTDLVSLLRAQGERPVRSGREFRPPNDPSITVRGNKWFDHSARVGGYAVSFVQRYAGCEELIANIRKQYAAEKTPYNAMRGDKR